MIVLCFCVSSLFLPTSFHKFGKESSVQFQLWQALTLIMRPLRIFIARRSLKEPKSRDVENHQPHVCCIFICLVPLSI